jgi:hypothetical protein
MCIKILKEDCRCLKPIKIKLLTQRVRLHAKLFAVIHLETLRNINHAEQNDTTQNYTQIILKKIYIVIKLKLSIQQSSDLEYFH